MSSLTLKNIPPVLLERLRLRAASERRSLSAEALMILDRALALDYRSPEERAETGRIWTEIAKRSNGAFDDWDIDGLYAARTRGRDL